MTFFFLQYATKMAREKRNTTKLNYSKSRSTSEEGDDVYLIELEGYYEHLPRNQMLNSDKYCSHLNSLEATINKKKYSELANRRNVNFHQKTSRPHTYLQTRRILHSSQCIRRTQLTSKFGIQIYLYPYKIFKSMKFNSMAACNYPVHLSRKMPRSGRMESSNCFENGERQQNRKTHMWLNRSMYSYLMALKLRKATNFCSDPIQQ